MDQHPSPIARLSRELGDSGTKEILPPTERNLTMLSEGKLEELADRFTRSAAWRRKHKVGANGGYVTADDFDEVLALISELRALRVQAALGEACEANGLAGYAPSGEMWFQPPGDWIAEQAVDAALRAQAPAPVGGEVVEALADALRMVLPLARGYRPEGQTVSARRSCDGRIEHAEGVLASLSPDPTEGGEQ